MNSMFHIPLGNIQLILRRFVVSFPLGKPRSTLPYPTINAFALLEHLAISMGVFLAIDLDGLVPREH